MTKPTKDPPQQPDFRQPFEVGLKRHLKPKSKISPWMEEWTGLIVVGAIMISLTIPLVWSYNHPSTPAAPRTSLEVVSGPNKILPPQQSGPSKSISTRIKNVGKEPALDVTVSVIIDGATYELDGPSKVTAGGTAEYSGVHEAFAQATEPLAGAVSCSNCD